MTGILVYRVVTSRQNSVQVQEHEHTVLHGYLADKKQPPPGSLGGAVSYERGTHVVTVCDEARSMKRGIDLDNAWSAYADAPSIDFGALCGAHSRLEQWVL